MIPSHCHECQLELREGDQVRLVIEEHETSIYELPVHADCRLALAREYSRLLRLAMVLMMQRMGSKDFGSGGDISLRPIHLSPAEAPEEPALLSEAS